MLHPSGAAGGGGRTRREQPGHPTPLLAARLPLLHPCVLTWSWHPVPLFPWINQEGWEHCGVDKGGIVQAPYPPQLQPCGSRVWTAGCVGLDGTWNGDDALLSSTWNRDCALLSSLVCTQVLWCSQHVTVCLCVPLHRVAPSQGTSLSCSDCLDTDRGSGGAWQHS